MPYHGLIVLAITLHLLPKAIAGTSPGLHQQEFTMISSEITVTSLPDRAGPAPQTTRHNPQQQTNQIPDRVAYIAFRDVIASWPGVIRAPSLRAPPGTIGLFLAPEEAKGTDEAFLLSTEFAHLHPLPDGSLHMVLPPEAHAAAVKAGWGIPHPMAGMPSVSSQTILIYAPRDAAEREVVMTLVASAERFARGRT
jgi:Family of unknown function (DUF5519)